MESQQNLQEAGDANASAVTGGIPLVTGTAISGQRPSIPPTPFFHGFPGTGNQLPFLYSHSYMPPIPGFGFSTPAQGTPSATIDLTEGSQKRGPKKPSLTTPSPTRNGEPPGRNRKLSNWTMAKKM